MTAEHAEIITRITDRITVFRESVLTSYMEYTAEDAVDTDMCDEVDIINEEAENNAFKKLILEIHNISSKSYSEDIIELSKVHRDIRESLPSKNIVSEFFTLP